MRVLKLLEEFRGRIIDAHCHIGSDQRFLLKGDVETILEAMNRYGIAKAFISAVQSIVQDFKEGNKRVLEAVRKYPNRFIGLVAVNPYYEDEAINELKKYVTLGFKGIKLHPFYFSIPMTCELTYKVLSVAEQLKVPVMIHSYDGGVEVSKIAHDFPNLTIVMYHMGGVKWKEGVDRVKKFDNVYVEVSSSIADVGMIEYAVKTLGSERVLFGSDMPYIDPSVSLGKILGSKISKYDMEVILCENAKKFM